MLHEILLRLKSLVERLEELDKKDTELRAELRELGHALTALGDGTVQISTAESAPGSPPVPSAPTSLSLTPSPPPADTPADTPAISLAVSAPFHKAVSELRPGPLVRACFEHSPAPSPPIVGPTVTDEDLPIIEARCRLKAEAARFAATRLARIRAGDNSFADFETDYHDLIARAKALPECFLWMCRAEDFRDADPKQLDDLAGCFETSARALGILRSLVSSPESDPTQVEQALLLCAEAQSAIWKAVADLNRISDADQLKLYVWLKDAGSQRRVWFDRFMTRYDHADPSGWPDLQARIQAIESQQQDQQARERQRRKLFGKIRHHLKRVTERPAPESLEDWGSVRNAIVELVEGGLPPSNVELRDLLLPVLDDIPEVEDAPKEFRLVLRETDRYLASLPSRALAMATTPSDQACRVARLLRGKAVALIGGAPRLGAKEALEEAFGLSELIWLENRDQSHSQFAPHIARPDVAVVLLAIRWSRHSFGEVKEYCDQHEKPLVRLPAGYNPNQVAHQILSQVGEQLAGNRERVAPIKN